MKWLVIAALLASTGCKKKHEEPAPAPTTGSAAMTGSAAPAPEPVATGSATAGSAAVDIPTEQDFEAQANKDITDKNVDNKLKTLEEDLAH